MMAKKDNKDEVRFEVELDLGCFFMLVVIAAFAVLGFVLGNM